MRSSERMTAAPTFVFRFADGVSDDSNDSDPNDDRLNCFNSEVVSDFSD
jgi:hypothetical protein